MRFYTVLFPPLSPQLLRDFLSDVDFAELSLQLTELVEMTVVPVPFTTTPSSPHSTELGVYHSDMATSPSPPLHLKQGSPSKPISPRFNEMAIPTDIRISGLQCIKVFVFVESLCSIPYALCSAVYDFD